MTTDSKRKPWLAMLASLLMPGLGQTYNAQAGKGLILFLLLALIVPLSAWLTVIGPKHIMLVSVIVFELIAIAIYVYGIIDAGRNARRQPASLELKNYNRAYVYVLALLLGGLIFYSLFDYRMGHLLQVVRIPSESMLPNILPGEYLLVDKRINCQGCRAHLQHGQVVVFRTPDKPAQLSIKRIIGLPGDKIVIKGSQISVNDIPTRSIEKTRFDHAEQDELLATHSAWREKNDKAVYYVIWKKQATQKDYSLTVPDGKVFVLGDNRNDAVDSRQYGSVPLDKLIGVADQVGFSISKTRGIRGWRAGTVIDPIY